jgi:hypothetical protein
MKKIMMKIEKIKIMIIKKKIKMIIEIFWCIKDVNKYFFFI